MYTVVVLFIQPGSKRVGHGTEEKFAGKDTKAAILDPLSCISKETKRLLIDIVHCTFVHIVLKVK